MFISVWVIRRIVTGHYRSISVRLFVYSRNMNCADISRQVFLNLSQCFLGIARRGPLERPPISSDITPLVFFYGIIVARPIRNEVNTIIRNVREDCVPRFAYCHSFIYLIAKVQ